MAPSMKFIPSAFLMVIVLLNASGSAFAGMSCNFGGISLTCPVLFQDDSKQFCCYSENLPYCCDLPDYIVNNTAIIASVIGGAIVLLLLCILCSCCCCSCCLLAKRRQRDAVIYTPVLPASRNVPVTTVLTAYPTTVSPVPVPQHYPMQPTLHNPPPYTASSQPAFNPQYGKNV